MTVGKGLRVDHIEHGTQSSGLQLGDERVSVDNSVATSVDQQRTVTHAREQRGIEESGGLGCERCEYHDGVGLFD